jgi:hypothetical protein
MFFSDCFKAVLSFLSRAAALQVCVWCGVGVGKREEREEERERERERRLHSRCDKHTQGRDATRNNSMIERTHELTNLTANCVNVGSCGSTGCPSMWWIGRGFRMEKTFSLFKTMELVTGSTAKISPS